MVPCKSDSEPANCFSCKIATLLIFDVISRTATIFVYWLQQHLFLRRCDRSAINCIVPLPPCRLWTVATIHTDCTFTGPLLRAEDVLIQIQLCRPLSHLSSLFILSRHMKCSAIFLVIASLTIITSGHRNLTKRPHCRHTWMFQWFRLVASVCTAPSTCFLVPTRIHNPNGMSICSALFAQLTTVSSGMSFPLKIAPLYWVSLDPIMVSWFMVSWTHLRPREMPSRSVEPFLQGRRKWMVQLYSPGLCQCSSPCNTCFHEPTPSNAWFLGPPKSSTQFHLDQFSLFHSSQQSVPILYNGPPFTLKIINSHGDVNLHLIHGSLDPPESSTKMASQSVELFLQGLLLWQNDRPHCSFSNMKPHLHTIPITTHTTLSLTPPIALHSSFAHSVSSCADANCNIWLFSIILTDTVLTVTSRNQ